MCKGYDVECPKCGFWNYKKTCAPLQGTKKGALECTNCGVSFEVVKIKIITTYDKGEKRGNKCS